MDKVDKARAALQEALELAQSRNDQQAVATALAQLAYTYSATEPRRAVEYLLRSLSTDSHVGWSMRLDIFDHLSTCYRTLGDRRRSFEYTCDLIATAVQVHGLDALGSTRIAIKWGEFVVESANPACSVSWQVIGQRMSEAGLQDYWLKSLADAVPAMVAQDISRVSCASDRLSTRVAVKKAFRLAVRLAGCPYVNWMRQIIHLLLAGIEKDAVFVAQILDDLSGEEVSAKETLEMRPFTAIALSFVSAPSDPVDELYCKLAHADAMEVLGAVAQSLEDLSHRFPDSTVRIASRLLRSGNASARETAICGLERLAQSRHNEVLRLLRESLKDPASGVARTAARILRDHAT